VIAIMDDRLLRASVELARIRAERTGAVRVAALAVADAERVLRRLTAVHEQRAAAATELDDARTGYEQAEARQQIAVENAAIARAELELEQRRLDRLTIRAPFDGRVVRTWARPGEALTMASPIVMMVGMDPLEAEFHMPVRLYGTLSVGRLYTLVADPPVDGSLEARLRFVSPVIDASSRTFRCVFDIPNPDERLPSGFPVHLVPPTARPIATAVPGRD
jgi:RND family efflux transporter MFP subunit